MSEIPVEIFYTLLEVVISNGIKDFVYPFSLVCWTFHMLVNDNINSIMNKYTLCIEEENPSSLVGISCLATCKLKLHYHTLAGVLHGRRSVSMMNETSHIKIEELDEWYRLGDRHGSRVKTQYFGKVFICDYEWWSYGSRQNSQFTDEGVDGEVHTRRIVLCKDGMESSLHFRVDVHNTEGKILALLEDDTGDVLLVQERELSRKDLLQLPLLDNYCTWNQLYFDIKKMFAKIYPEFIDKSEKLDEELFKYGCYMEGGVIDRTSDHYDANESSKPEYENQYDEYWERSE
jgi:hypothetical protein